MQLAMILSPASHGSQSFTMYSPKGPQHNWGTTGDPKWQHLFRKNNQLLEETENKCAAPLCLLHYSKSHKVEAI